MVAPGRTTVFKLIDSLKETLCLMEKQTLFLYINRTILTDMSTLVIIRCQSEEFSS